MHPRNEALLRNARALRKHMTKEERRLWYGFLREYPLRFRRQEIIGNYIVDFYCSQAALIIELDGSQHFEEKGRTDDAARSEELGKWGFFVLRFSNRDVLESFPGVCERIDMEVQRRVPRSDE